MGKKLAERLGVAFEEYRKIVTETEFQFFSDLVSVTLNDSRIMGKDVFGHQRLKKVLLALQNANSTYADMLNPKKDEADFYQYMMDEQLKRIFEEDFVPFKERYPWISQGKL